MAEKQRCSTCGQELLSDAPAGLCVPCSLRTVLQTFPFPNKGGQIGRYKLLDQIGEGGCGIVYLAEQYEPVRRRVALKLIKPGMDSKDVLARFEAERQALALMDHPNIAKVLDAGATDNGHPYFVMELVKGQRITEYCDQAELSTAERLRLFVEVCQAVQHAHQKGIIHRDLKPSNILVSLQDGTAVPKVIDFGIAKATGGQSLTDKTLFTALDQFMGTPAYMSPEQAELTGLDIDTRSDVYSLGVLLYELLTGHTPFETKELLAKGLDEIRRIIREDDVPRPSTKLSTLAANEQALIARHRRAEPPKLLGLIRGDLDWIVMKSLEKERQRRYESASALAADVQRHLSDETVTARPPSRLYRLRKLVRRNKLAFAAGTAVVASLVIGLTLSTVLFFRERAARQAAKAVNDFLLEDILRADDSAQSMSYFSAYPNYTFRKALERAAGKVSQRFKGQPLEQAAILLAIGDGMMNLGDSEVALTNLQQGVELSRAKLGPNHPKTLDAMNALSQAYLSLNRFDEARSLLEDAFQRSRATLGPTNRTTLAAMNNLAFVYREEGRINQAMPLLEEGLKLDRANLGEADRETLDALVNLAGAYRMAGKPKSDLVLPMMEEAVKLAKANFGLTDPETLDIMHNLAVFYQETKTNQAPPLFAEVLSNRTATLGPDHPATLSTLVAYGRDLVLRGDYTNAEQVLRRGLDASQTKKPDDWIESAAQAHLGKALLMQQKYAEAEPFLLKGYIGMKDQEADIPPGARPWLKEAGRLLVSLYKDWGKTNEMAAWKQKLQTPAANVPPKVAP